MDPKVNDTNTCFGTPGLRINRVLRVMLQT